MPKKNKAKFVLYVDGKKKYSGDVIPNTVGLYDWILCEYINGEYCQIACYQFYNL